MPTPIRLLIEGSAAGATRAAEETRTAVRSVSEQVQRTNADIVEQARATVRANIEQRDTIAETAAAYRRAAQQYVAGSREQIEAIRLARAEHAKLGTAATVAAKEAKDANVVAAEETLTVWRRAYRAIMGTAAEAAAAQTASAREAAGAAASGATGGVLSRVRGGAGAVAGGVAGLLRRGEATSSGEERGVLRVASREAGVGSILGGPAVIAGAGIATALVESIRVTLQAQQSQAQLQNALTNTGVSWARYRDQINGTLDAQEKLSGFERNDLRDAFTSLLRRTGDVGKATQGLGEATNLARGAHIDLGRAVTIVTRAYQGNVGQLARLGINVPKVTEHMDRLREAHIKVGDANRAQVIQLTRQAQALDKQATATAAVDEIERKYHGAAIARTRTLAGQIDALRNQVLEWATAIGTRAIPYATRLFQWLNHLIDSIKGNHELLRTIRNDLDTFATGLRTVWDGVSALWGVLNHGERVIGGVAIAFGLLYAASPFLTILAAAIFAVGEIRKHWGAILGFFQGLWIDIRKGFAMVWEAIRYAGQMAFYGLVQYATLGLREMLSVAAKAVGWIPGVGDKVKHALAAINDWVASQKPTWDDTWSQIGASNASAYASALMSGVQAAAAGLPSTFAGANAEAAAKGAHGVALAGGMGFRASGSPAAIAVGAARQPGAASSTAFHLQGERTPYDCSAFTQAVFRQANIRIGGDTYAQYGGGRKVAMNDLQPDDLVFFNYPGERWPGHVGIYVGGGMVVHDHGAHGVVTEVPLSSMGGNHAPEARCYMPSHNHATSGGVTPPAVGDGGFNAGIAAAQANQPPPRTRRRRAPATVTQTQVDAFNESLGQLMHRYSVDLGSRGLDATPQELQQIAHLNRLLAELHAGAKPSELARIRTEIKAITDQIGNEIDVQTKAYDKAKRARAAFVRTLVPIRQLVSGIISAATPGRADPTQAIGTAVGDLQNLGETPDARAQTIVARLRRLSTELGTLTRPGQARLRDRIKTEIQQWGAALNDELQRQLSKAQQTAEDQQTRLDRAWRDIQTQAQRTFDAQTQQWETRFDAETTATVDRMQRDLQQQIASTAAIVNTAYGQFSILPGGQTPGEQALAALQSQQASTDLQRTLSDAQDALKRANLIGDPGQIRDTQRAVEDAQRAIDEARLQQQATDERSAADRALQDLSDQLTAQGNLRIQSYQDDRAAARASYDQARADQWQHIQDELDDWHTMIDEKRKSYAEFLQWYATQSLGAPPSSFTSATGAGASSAAGIATLGQMTVVNGVAVNPYSLARVFGSGPGGPRLQTGAYVRTPTRALVGDVPEFVVPESWLPPELRASIMNILAARHAPGASPVGGSGGGGGGYGGGAGGTTIYAPVFVGGSVVAERDLALGIRDHLVRVGQRSGGNVFGGQA